MLVYQRVVFEGRDYDGLCVIKNYQSRLKMAIVHDQRLETPKLEPHL